MSQTVPPPQGEGAGKLLGWLDAVKGLTLTNALVIILLLVVAAPIYLMYRALNDEKLLDRFLSTYQEFAGQQAGCTLRHVRQRGGPHLWSISSGFAYQGGDRWSVNVTLSREPNGDEIYSYCQALKVVSDSMLGQPPQ